MLCALALLPGCRRMETLGSANGEVPGGARVRVVRLTAPAAAYGRFVRWGGANEMIAGARRWWDPAARVCGGYELRVKALGNGQFDVRVELLGASMDGFRRVDLPDAVAPRVLRAGESFEVDLIRADGVRLYDRVEVVGGSR